VPSVLTTERQSVSEQVKAQLLNKINPYGLTEEIFNIVNFNFSEEFNAAVEAKQTAEQQALKAEQDLNRIKIEAQQKVTQAQAEADSIKLIQDTLKTSPEYIEYMKWQKWDGVLPKVMTGSDGSTIVDVGNVLDPSAAANSSAAPQQ
jgi:prohibitin 2